MNAKKMQKANRKGGAQAAIAEMHCKHKRRGPLLRLHGLHRRHAVDRHLDENRSGNIKTSEDKEVARQPKTIDNRRRHQSAEQVRCHIPGNVGGEGPSRIAVRRDRREST
jgi:hypothetical protein